MNRIKFRIWDKTKEGWVKDNDMIACPNGQLVWTDCGIYYLSEDLEHNFIVQQFTGCLDKDGKEIYEGDIVQQAFDTAKDFQEQRMEWSGVLYEAIWVEDQYSFMLKYKAYGLYYDSHFPPPHERQYIKIIGNIFDTKEKLLSNMIEGEA